MQLRSRLALSGMLVIAHRYHACTGNEAPLSTGLILEYRNQNVEVRVQGPCVFYRIR